jgi:hypothetical protein
VPRSARSQRHVHVLRTSRSHGEAAPRLPAAPSDVAAPVSDVAIAPDAAIDDTIATRPDASAAVPVDAHRRPPSDARGKRPQRAIDAERNFYIAG